MDHIADKNLTVLHDIRASHKLPEFVKDAQIDKETISGLPSGSFADPVGRTFPCHTRADTFLSYAYFLKHASQVPNNSRAQILERLKKFAHDWSIHTQCTKLQREHEKQASSDISSLSDDKFAIVEEYNSEKYRALPLLDEKCVKEAAAHLRQYADRYPISWRKKAARKIASAARNLNLTLDGDYIAKAAGETMPCRADIARGMYDRATMLNSGRRGSRAQTKMAKAAATLAKSSGDFDPAVIETIIDRFDNEFDLRKYYSRGLPTPEEVVYSGFTEKRASDIKGELVRLTSGTTYTKTALANAGLEPYRVLGDDFINEVRGGLDDINIEKLAAIVPTLPTPDANLLDRALREVGVRTADNIRKTAGLPDDISSWTAQHWGQLAELTGA